MEIYVAEKGNTISTVAEKYGINPQILAELNGLFENTELLAGQSVVVIYPKTVYTAKEGDTLFKIAESFGTTLRSLFRNNPRYAKNSSLVVGDKIVIEFESDSRQPVKTNGYAYPFVQKEVLNSFLPYMTYLSPFTYGFTYEGDIVDLNDGELLKAAAEFGVLPLMHLSTLTESGTFSNELASAVLNSKDLSNRLADTVENIVDEKGYFGLDIDFEFISSADSLLYPEFIQTLRSRLNPKGKVVYSALAPKVSDTQKGSLYEGHNYFLIGEASNGVLLMTYEWGYTYGPPMAVAPINLVRRVLEYALLNIPPEKIFLGIPNYGYDWTLPFEKGKSKARSISNPEAIEIAREYGADILFDETSKTPYFNYTDGEGKKHEVWFEDARSITAKYNLIKEFNLLGAGFWNLMRPFQTGMSILNNLFEVE